MSQPASQPALSDAAQDVHADQDDGRLMWKRFTWRGHEVVVIQQWGDPFGRAMLRFADPHDEDRAVGMPVARFLGEATAKPD